ncbi:STAS domain-containing protein [Pseudoflavitalea sp. G-6-1-2]|uniref:SulP family inorganic anion transporter n=1 Tax=Pseudoflavitalea sp. G-6-1-2 TaxID=2728841 RepID=UPI00146E363A|nr:SulP family inorganic anion transporter [Pseudoflavitalea sp. G-6-1-2]NML21229.1 STAS domain-containing protein [Pseudoflavitalea sp. G-6-1-2]
MRKEKYFYPALPDALKNYSLPVFYKDLQAGLIVGIVALPLAIAFGIASGVSPQTGIITAIIAGFIISAMGGSTVQIGGPTGAFVVIVAGIVQQYGLSGLITATFIAGILLILMGMAKLGTVIRFIPYPLIVGFTSGIALIIALTQVNDVLGLKIERIPGDLTGRLHAYISHIATINGYSVALALFTILLLIFWPRITHKIPGSLIALLITTMLVHWLHLPVETIADRFGQISSAFPAPHFSIPDLDTIRKLFQPAIAIALLGAIESLLSAVVADGMTGKRHHSNTELIAQGAANIFSSLFGGIPATGAIARTATNIKNGAQTPVAGIIHAITLLLILLFLGKWAALVPMATLAGILIIVAYNMSEWQHFRSILKGSAGDVTVLLASFGLTVLIDLTVAIETGMILALIFFVKNLVKQTEVLSVKQTGQSTESRNLPMDVEVFEIEGPLFFGAVYKFTEALRQIEKPPRVLILRMKQVPLIDASGIKALKDALKDCKKRKTKLILSEITNQHVMDELRRSRLLFAIGKANVTGSFDAALKRSSNL